MGQCPSTAPLIILGPTATGKSQLALALARRQPAEIVSLDSMQIYRGMDIGTAKPTAAERAAVPHHLIDCCAPDQPSDAAKFLAQVRAAEQAIVARGARPILVGGTAMYIKALVDGLCDAPARQPLVRAQLAEAAQQRGSAHLHNELQRVDAVAAARIHPHDLRRIVRALEVYQVTGTPLSTQQGQWAAPAATPYVMVGLTMAREELYRRIDARVDAMLAAGLVDEVRRLRDAGLEQNPIASQAIGYKELLAHLRGECALATAVELMKRATRRFAKHQMTWFRKDTRIRWYDVAAYADAARLAAQVWSDMADTATPHAERAA
jgi:tRNA dimethylallyltransferase